MPNRTDAPRALDRNPPHVLMIDECATQQRRTRWADTRTRAQKRRDADPPTRTVTATGADRSRDLQSVSSPGLIRRTSALLVLTPPQFLDTSSSGVSLKFSACSRGRKGEVERRASSPRAYRRQSVAAQRSQGADQRHLASTWSTLIPAGHGPPWLDGIARPSARRTR